MTYRSKAEKEFANVLADAKINFAYEPNRIPYVVSKTYLPDFYLVDYGFYIEFKGYFKPSDRTKHKLIKEQNPLIDIRFVFMNANKKLNKTSKTSYGFWCDQHGFKWAENKIPDEWLTKKKKVDCNNIIKEAAKGVPWAVEFLRKINQGGQPVQQPLNPQVQRGMAEGGPILESGSFVIPADVVSSFGDGSSDEGHRKLSQQFGGFALGGNVLGGEIKGPGGGLDDLVQSSIEGVKSARVSNDEFVIPSNVVNRIGGGNTKAGSEKLYNFIKNVRLNKHGTSKQPASINNVGIKSLLG